MGIPTAVWVLMIVAFVLTRRRRPWGPWRGTERFPRPGHPRPGRDTLEGRPGEPFEGYVEALEIRVARLEERLDFTERLLQRRAGMGEEEAPAP